VTNSALVDCGIVHVCPESSETFIIAWGGGSYADCMTASRTDILRAAEVIDSFLLSLRTSYVLYIASCYIER